MKTTKLSTLAAHLAPIKSALIVARNTHIRAVIEHYNGNHTHAAQALDISHRTLMRWIAERTKTDEHTQRCVNPPRKYRTHCLGSGDTIMYHYEEVDELRLVGLRTVQDTSGPGRSVVTCAGAMLRWLR